MCARSTSKKTIILLLYILYATYNFVLTILPLFMDLKLAGLPRGSSGNSVEIALPDLAALRSSPSPEASSNFPDLPDCSLADSSLPDGSLPDGSLPDGSLALLPDLSSQVFRYTRAWLKIHIFR